MIKECTPYEIDATASLGFQWAEDFDIEDFDIDAWGQHIRKHSIHANLCWFNFQQGNRIVGFVSGQIGHNGHNTTPIAQINYLYLIQGQDTDENLYELHRQFSQWAKERNATKIITSDFVAFPKHYLNLFQDLGYASNQAHTLVMEVR